MTYIKIDLATIELLSKNKQTSILKDIHQYITVELKKGNSIILIKNQEEPNDNIIFHNMQELISFYGLFLEKKTPELSVAKGQDF